MSDQAPDQEEQLVRRVEEIQQGIYEQNPDFNAKLNGHEPLEIASIKDSDTSYRIEKSEALFWVDRHAYKEELATWHGKRAEARHEKSIAHLKSHDQIGLFKELVEAIKRHRIAPFIGAGMSCASSFPMWGEALQELLQKVDCTDEESVRRAIQRKNYVRAAELLWQTDEDQVKLFIRSKFAKSRLPQEGANGAIRLLQEISQGCIVTTNYDRVIESLVPSLDGQMHGLQSDHNFVANLIRGERCLLKLHGDTDNHASYVFTQTQYNAAYGKPFNFKLPLPKALRQIYISHSLLFLGCSLVQDYTLRLFQQVKESEDFAIPDHFAVLPEPIKKSARVQKENRLLKIGIRPIWYPADEHQYVEALLTLAIDVARGVITL